MSSITDVGVNFKMTGMEAFENRLKTLESQFKSLSETITKAPQVDNQFQKMTSAAQKASEKIVGYMGAAKAAVLAVMTAKAGSGAFNWAIGSKTTADAKADTSQYVDPASLNAYEAAMSRIRDQHEFTKADLYKGAYQVDSAMADKSLEDRVKTFETIAYYAKLTGKSFEDASKLYKQFLAAFGEQLPVDKQKTFAEDTLGMLFKIGQITKSDPQQVADAVSRSAQTYQQFKMSQSRMFAEIAAMTPRMGGQPEMAATALRSLYPEAGLSAGKLAAKQYEEAFVRGQAMDDTGRRSRNWGSLRNLEVAAAEGNEQATKDLREMKNNADRYQKDTAAEIQQMMNAGNIEGIWKRIGDLVEQNKRHPMSAENLKDAFGLERLNVALGLIDFYKQGKIQELMRELEAARGQDAVDARAKADAQNLPHLWGLVKQGAEDLSASLRAIFYEPMKMLLEEWKGVFKQLESDMGGEGGMKKLKEWSSGMTSGLREGYYGQASGEPDTRSAAQIFQDFMSGLSAEDWRQAGVKIGKAASDFLTITGQLKDIIGSVHKLISSVTSKEMAIPGAAAVTAYKYTPGSPITKGLVATGAFMATDALVNGSQNAPSAEEMEARAARIQNETWKRSITNAGIPTHASSGNVAAPQPLSTREFATPPVINITSSPMVTINADDQAIKDALKAEVKDEVKQEIQGDMDRSRPNATDWGHVGGY